MNSSNTPGAVAGSLSRHTLTAGGVAGIVSAQDEILKLVSLVITVIGLAWSIYEKISRKTARREDGQIYPVLFIPFLLAALLCGCSSFSTHVFRAEQTSVDLVHAGYVGWTNYLGSYPVSPTASNEVKAARLQFAASVGTLDALRQTYETNSAVKPQVRAALDTLVSHSTNVLWLIHYWRNQ